MHGDRLLIGVGNPLRGDDGIGAAIVAHAEQAHAGAWAMLACHQLLPEYAALLSHYTRVVIADAAYPTPTMPIGTVRCVPVQPEFAHSFVSPHHLTPATLLGWTQLLYGTLPRLWLVTIAGADFGYSDTLSPVVQAVLPAAVAQCAACLAG
jgi:hydrogenase maturation protease